MQRLFVIFLAINFLCCKKMVGQEQLLFQIEKGGKIGFINNQGKVIIQPQFLSAGEFSEGLAPARISGVYGYIDTTGTFVIASQFDYATSFSEGLAIVYNNDTLFFINANGSKAFSCNYKSAEPFFNGRSLVKTATGKSGIIDKSGKLIIDTAFEVINPFIKGLAVAYGLRDTAEQYGGDYKVGIIDSTGKFIVAFGKYMNIEDYQNGLFKIAIRRQKNDTITGYTEQSGFVDTTGKLILSKSYENHFYILGYPHQGLVKVCLYKHWIPEEKGTTSPNSRYEGFMNIKGEIIINDTTFEEVTDFSDNRAFVQIKGENGFGWHYRMISTSGKFITNKKFDNINKKGFLNGVAMVEFGRKWGLIDTNANFIIQPKITSVDEMEMIDDLVFFNKWDPKPITEYATLYSILKTDGTIILKPVIQDFDRAGFKDGLLQCTINNKLTYINKQGKVVWQQAKSNTRQLADVNIDFMNRSYFYAASKSNKTDLGGFGKSENKARRILSTEKFQPSSLSVVVKAGNDTFQNAYHGLKVYVANTTSGAIEFTATDSRLNMKVQALNKIGEWKDIEYLSSSWCGNSYHTLTLNPNHCWRFTTPKYTGDFKTKLRIALSYTDSNNRSEKRRQRKELTIYSNEYTGSVNPGQFWRLRDYYPTNLMDPYTE